MLCLNRSDDGRYYWAPIDPDHCHEHTYISALEARKVLEKRGCPPDVLNKIMTEKVAGTIML